MTTTKTRTAIYARSATDRQSGSGISNQLAACEKIAQREGFEVVEKFCDEATSGASIGRPGLGALVAAARSREVDAVLVASLDRLSRDQVDLIVIIDELRSFGVQIVTVDGGVF